MAKFRVWAESVDYYYVDIEAENEEAAYKYADEFVDGGDFHGDCAFGDWEMRPDLTHKLDDDVYVDFVVGEGNTEIMR